MKTELFKEKEERIRADILGYLPIAVKREIEALKLSRKGCISEIRLRFGRASSLLIDGERIALSSELSQNELDECVFKLTGGSLYAYRDTIAEGYIPIPEGVRVGVSGQARYEGGALVGISDISSLVFRIPTAYSSFSYELCEAFWQASSGLLIYSPPGSGKTTALRSLALRLSSGRGALNVAVIDERNEFLLEDYRRAYVDILRGYKKSDGMEIALRALSPDVIMVDEIGCEREAYEMLSYVNAGVKIVASAHASSYDELRRKKNLEPFFKLGVFDSFAGLRRAGAKFYCEVKHTDA